MSKKLYPEEDIQAIANAIRALNGSSDTYTVGDMAEAIEMPDNAYYLKETEADNPLSIADGEELNAQSCEVAFEPIQDLHGYDSPWPDGGGKNKFNKDYGVIENKYIGTDGTIYNSTTPSTRIYTHMIPVNGESQYTISGKSTENAIIRVCEYSVSGVIDPPTGFVTRTLTENMINPTITITTQPTTAYIVINPNSTVTDIQVEQGSTATSYSPYSNICPISGRDSVTMYQGIDADLRSGRITECTMQSTGRLVSGSSNDIIYCPCEQGKKYFLLGSLLGTSVYAFYSSEPEMLSYSYNNTRYSGVLAEAPINGWLAYRIAKTATDYSIHEYYDTHTATFSSTIYGGEYEFVEGELKKTLSSILDLGTITWTKTAQSGYTFFYATVSGKKIGYDAQLICSQYKQYNEYFAGMDNGQIANNALYKYIYIRDDNKANLTAEEFKAAMSGVELCYELATPIDTQLDPDCIKLLQNNNVFTTDGKTVKVRYLSKHI